MALRTIRTEGDEVLKKVSRPVKEMTPRIRELIVDMLDTMYDSMGVGLAAPQVGILKRIVTIDVGEGPIVLINPEILETSGEQTGEEGCLSVPGMSGLVTRPNYVKVKALDLSESSLINQLRSLKEDGFISRHDYKELPPRVEYSLTDLGQSFMPIMEHIKDWGETHLFPLSSSR